MGCVLQGTAVDASAFAAVLQQSLLQPARAPTPPAVQGDCRLHVLLSLQADTLFATRVKS